MANNRTPGPPIRRDSGPIIISKLDIIENKVTNLQIETAAQTVTLASVDARVKILESDKVPIDRVRSLEEKMKEGQNKLIDLEKQSASTTARYDSINKDIGGINKDISDIKTAQITDRAEFKPVREFVLNAKFILPLFTGMGGIIGAILTAVILKLVLK
jgi:septation ring formation regulator EzrA